VYYRNIIENPLSLGKKEGSEQAGFRQENLKSADALALAMGVQACVGILRLSFQLG
jgi:hypothetical protein